MSTNKFLAKVLGICVLAFSGLFLACQGEFDSAASGLHSVESKAFTSTAGSNSLTITLVGGIFAPEEKLSVSQFTITSPGTDSTVDLIGGKVIRVNNTNVRITGFTSTMSEGSAQKITISGSALAKQATAARVTFGSVGTETFDGGTDSGGETFDGGTTGGGGTDSGTSSSSSSTSAVSFNAVASNEFTSVVGGTRLVITLTGGTFQDQADLSIAQFKMSKLVTGWYPVSLAGQVNRTSDTEVTLIDLQPVVTAESNLKINIDGSALASQAASADVTPLAAAALPALTGTASITGTPEVGQTLTANLSLLGGSGTAFVQWKRNFGSYAENIAVGYYVSGGSYPAYTVRYGDVGATITVEVTRFDNSGSISGGPTAQVPPALDGWVSLSGNNEVGSTLTVDTGNLTGTGAAPAYRWKRNGVAFISSASPIYVLRNADAGTLISVEVTRAGYTGSKNTNAIGPIVIYNVNLTGTVSIANNAIVGEPLTVNTAALEGNGTIEYQWETRDFWYGSAADIPGANSRTYTPTHDELGKRIRVRVTRSKNTWAVGSNTSELVHLGFLTGSVGIAEGAAGTPTGTLTAHVISLSGVGPILYQWKRDGVPIAGENSAEYVSNVSDIGTVITVEVSRANYGGTISGTLGYTTIPGVVPINHMGYAGNFTTYDTPTPANVSWPGMLLIPDTSDLGGSGTISYKWKQNAGTYLKEVLLGTDIGTNETYLVTDADVGKYITLDVYRAGEIGYVRSYQVYIQKNPILPRLTGSVFIYPVKKGISDLPILHTDTRSLGGSGTIQYTWDILGITIFTTTPEWDTISWVPNHESTLEVSLCDHFEGYHTHARYRLRVRRTGYEGEVVAYYNHYW